MNIIGTRLNSNEMLAIKGGSHCMVCRCNSGDEGPFYSMDDSPSNAQAKYGSLCGEGITATCGWPPGHGNCPGVS